MASACSFVSMISTGPCRGRTRSSPGLKGPHEPEHRNPEFALRDPDGYYVTISALPVGRSDSAQPIWSPCRLERCLSSLRSGLPVAQLSWYCLYDFRPARRATPAAEASQAREATPSHVQATQQRFLDMWARSYFPGRTGQLLIVPREGDFITRPDPNYPFMHGSPWAYDVEIPLMFAGPAVKAGTYSMPAVQQDVAPTLAAALGVHMPPTSTGRVLPVLQTGMAPPRVVVLIVLDGMRRDYFDRYATLMPTLTALRQRGAWFSQAQLNILPSTTAVGHSTIATGTDPAIHGVTGNNMYDRIGHVRHEIFAGAEPGDLMALTLADVWQFATSGRAIILAQGSIDRAAIPLAGHGACQLNGVPVVLASYDPRTGNWSTNPHCYRLPAYLKDLNASALWAGDAEWMHHKIDTPAAVRYSALFPAFEADAMVAMIEHEPIGEDGIADLILLNYKVVELVGHEYGPDSRSCVLPSAQWIVTWRGYSGRWKKRSATALCLP